MLRGDQRRQATGRLIEMRRVGKAEACPPTFCTIAHFGGHGANAPLPTLRSLVPQLRLDHGLAKLGAAVGAFISELDLRHAPVRLDVPNEHRKPDAARANDEGRLDVIVLVDIGWHHYSPRGSIHQ